LDKGLMEFGQGVTLILTHYSMVYGMVWMRIGLFMFMPIVTSCHATMRFEIVIL